jgi:Na+/melibiose symporter-like transporter
VGVEIIKHYGTENAQGYRVVGVACALVGFVICLLHYYFTEERNPIGLGSSEDNIKWSDVLVSLRKNPLFLALCIHGICICAMQSMFNSVATYMYGDVYGDIGLMKMMYPASAPAMFIIFGLSPWLSKKIGLEKLIRYSLFVGTIGFALLTVVTFSFEISPLAFLIISSMAMGIPTLSIQMQWGLVAESIDYNRVVTGKTMEGSIYGTFNLARRIGGGIGQGGVVLGLLITGYNEDLVKAGIPIESFTADGIKLMNTIIPGIFVLGSWLAFKYLWKITPEMKQKIKELR